MTDHAEEQVFPGEPEGGWAKAPTLVDTEIVSIVLCKFIGVWLRSPDHHCAGRELGGHADVDCAAVFVRGKDAEGYDIPVGVISEIAVSIAGNDLNVQ